MRKPARDRDCKKKRAEQLPKPDEKDKTSPSGRHKKKGNSDCTGQPARGAGGSVKGKMKKGKKRESVKPAPIWEHQNIPGANVQKKTNWGRSARVAGIGKRNKIVPSGARTTTPKGKFSRDSIVTTCGVAGREGQKKMSPPGRKGTPQTWGTNTEKGGKGGSHREKGVKTGRVTGLPNGKVAVN